MHHYLQLAIAVNVFLHSCIFEVILVTLSL